MNNYQTVRLGDVCEIVMGTSPEGNTISQNASDGIEFHQGKTCFGDLYLNESGMFTNAPVRFADAGNVIMSVRAPVGDSNITPRKIAIGRGLCTFNTKSNFEKLFLYYYLNSKIDFLKSKSTGSTFKAVNKDVISDLKIPLPPLSEQKYIASVLDKCTEVIAKHREILDKYDTLVKSRFIEMFGDPVTNPMGWEVKKLGELTRIGSSKRIFEKEYVSEGVPFFRTKEIVELSKGNPITTELFISKERYEEIKQQFGIPKKNDLLVSAVGTIGIIWIVDGKQEFYFKDGNLIRIETSKYFDSVYLKMQLEALISEFKKKMNSGTAYSALTISGLCSMSVPVPPIDLQEKFADFVQAVDAQKAKAQKSLDKAETLYKALMQEYFEA